MATEKKILIVGKHGVKGPDGNAILPESYARLFTQGASLRDFIQEHDVSPSQTFIGHSNQIKTLRTAKATAAGAFRVPIMPEDAYFDNFRIPGLENITQVEGLSYEPNFKFNVNAYKQEGETAYMAKWIGNPQAEEYNGATITSFNDTFNESRGALNNTMKRLIHGNNKLGILTTHGGLIEALAIRALVPLGIDCPKETPEIFEQLGDHFPMEDYFTIEVECNPDKRHLVGKFKRIKGTHIIQTPVDIGSLIYEPGL